jgi:hypothetical protein
MHALPHFCWCKGGRHQAHLQETCTEHHWAQVEIAHRISMFGEAEDLPFLEDLNYPQF